MFLQMWTSRRLYIAIASQWLLSFLIEAFTCFAPCDYLPLGNDSFALDMSSLSYAQVYSHF